MEDVSIEVRKLTLELTQKNQKDLELRNLIQGEVRKALEGPTKKIDDLKFALVVAEKKIETMEKKLEKFENTRRCEFCGKKFTSLEGLQRHKTDKHSKKLEQRKSKLKQTTQTFS